MTKFPPFDTLVAFEVAARRFGMTQAAEELGLTQSAVSYRIKRLEAFMGTPLFARRGSGLELTPEGQALREALKDFLSLAGGLRARCVAGTAVNRLRVGVGSALGDNWLVRRLPDFSRVHPSTSIELVIVENEAPERHLDLDIRILWVPISETRATSTRRPLFREHVFPVCSPSLLPDGFTPGDASVLVALPLLHKRLNGHPSPAEGSWESWFERLGLTDPPNEAFWFTSIGPSVAAAIHGAGVALARTMVVQDALADGRLVRVLPPEHDQLSSKMHVVRWPGRLVGDPHVEAFASWLCARAREPHADGSPGAHQSA
jgi:LysR family transcriptional regulator, glycine cleavage system transcriptional activator